MGLPTSLFSVMVVKLALFTDLLFILDNFCDPLLSYFPRTLSFPDLMDALKNVYDEKLKGLNRTQKVRTR